MLHALGTFFVTLGLTISGWFGVHPAQPLGANSTISNLPTLSSMDSNDLFPVVDVSAGQTKNITFSNATGSMSTYLTTTFSPKAGSSNIITVGALTSGSLASGFTPVTVPLGGTGSTTLAANRLLMGNGTGIMSNIGGGVAGQYLVSNGPSSAPSFQTASVDQTLNYTWTGTHVFASTTATSSLVVNATSTFNKPTLGAGVFLSAVSSTTLTGATTPQPVFLATTTNSLVLSSPNSTTTDFLGFALQNATNGSTSTVQVEGVVPGFSGLTKGAPYYVTATGTIGTTQSSGPLVGYAISSTELLIKPEGSWRYIGSVSGTQNACGATSCTASTTMPVLAKYVVSNPLISFSNCGGGFSGDFQASMIFIRGLMESPVSSGSAYCPGATTPASAKLSGIISGGQIYVVGTNNSTQSGTTATFYFYR